MRITAEQWSVLSRLFDEAMELPQETRETWLEALGPLDAGLKAELRALLERHVRIETSDFLDTLPKFHPGEGTATDATESAALLAGAALTGFSGALLAMYGRTPALRRPGSIWPSQAGTAVSKDVWMLGIGLGLVTGALADRGNGS